MMSRKDYVAIAGALRAARELDTDKHAVDAVERVAEGLATVLGYDNPRFNSARFLKACGVQS